ncbi:MAG TPA: class I SAM-dependent methyltransferase [Bryobacteraceae bacterium]|jgi:O-antigen chain-terminating methyltransferase|nr:class I SAM-dependent methyltransferase [Bryobacteraceae bacterium]
MPAETDQDAGKIAELSAIILAVRERVRARYPEPGDHVPAEPSMIRIPVADLMPIVHARDAAQAKIAAIGSVNPRAGGLANSVVQGVKKAIARALQWFVRDQVVFNREVVSGLEAVLEALNEQNRIMLQLAGQTNELAGRLNEKVAPLAAEASHLRDLGQHWDQWRAEWEKRLATNEVRFLRSIAEMQGAYQHRSTLMESNFRGIVQAQHEDYKGALDRYGVDIQKRLWADMQKARQEYDRLIHDELRIIRLRGPAPVPAPAPVPPAALHNTPGALDYTRFAYRFRGTEEDVRKNHEAYRPWFADRQDVLDIGCGRGEFLDFMRDLGVRARGIDLGEESVAQCRGKGLNAEVADLFPYLEARPAGEFDGIFSSQVVEHLEPARLPEMIRLCASRLRRGGILAIETPNPECLAIFATYFYLDPTHTRPVPHPLLEFYMHEYGLGGIEVRTYSPAVESWPEIAELPEHFRERFFGGLDYAIIGRKL